MNKKKYIILIRHGEAERKKLLNIDDFGRSLSEQGQKEVKEKAEFLKSSKFIPELIYSSAAKRTLETAEIIANSVNYKDKIISLESLYLAPYNKIIKELQEVDDKINILMFVGHNPDIEILAKFIIRDSDKLQNFATSSVAVVKYLEDNWYNLEQNSCVLENFSK